MTIREGNIGEIVSLAAGVPEFAEPYQREVYEQRLSGNAHLILVAEDNGQLVGFKAGYDRYRDGSFYSWMGGLLPSHRNMGIYQQLTTEMEQWARDKGFSHILLKTRNRLKPMIRFCLSQGYYVSGFSAHADPMESRIYFRKDL